MTQHLAIMTEMEGGNNMVVFQLASGEVCALQDDQFICSNELTRKGLELTRKAQGPSGASANPELDIVREALEVFGGFVIQYDKPNFVPDRIY